jgi:hypothetical protein
MSVKVRVFAAVAAVALVGAVSAGSAGADQYSNDSTPGFTITAGVGPRFDTAVAGGAVFPSVGNFNNVTMNGTPQLTSAVIAPFTVIDDSGSGVGWHVTLLVPDFDDGGTPANVVDASGVQMNAPVVSSGGTNSVMGGVSSAANVDFTSAKSIVTADPGAGGAPVGPDGSTTVAGMGTYLVSPQILKLVVPANAIAGAYSTTATIAIVSGP